MKFGVFLSFCAYAQNNNNKKSNPQTKQKITSNNNWHESY